MGRIPTHMKLMCVCVLQVSQVVQKTPAQPRAGEVTAGRAGCGDGDTQR